jgi:hypothetical protein
MNEDTSKAKFISFVKFLLDDSAGRIARELWWTGQEFCPVDIIPPWFSMFIYHLWDEQYARWWSQFSIDMIPIDGYQYT